MRTKAGSWFASIAVLGVASLFAPAPAMGQGSIGVQPGVGYVPDGVSLGVTPAVSADRRYVRLSIGFGSSTVQGFQNIPFPVGAVGMGGGRLGGGGAGGLGGLGGAGGAGGAGGPGGAMSVVTGMNGPVAPGSMAGGGPAMAPAAPGPGYVASADPTFEGEAQPRRAPRRSRADRAKAERAKAAAAKAEADAKAVRPR